MPAITRYQTRQLVDKIKTDPYYTRAINNIQKHKTPAGKNLEILLNRDNTPDQEELLRAFVEVTQDFDKKMTQDHGLHCLSDIIYKSLAPHCGQPY